MVHPNTILSITPPKEIDTLINQLGVKKLNIYVDFKNACTSLFIDNVVQEIVNYSDMGRTVDNSIFQSIIKFASSWKKYALSKQLDYKIFYMSDHGKSYYHVNLHDGYKNSRHVGDVNLPDYYKDLIPIRRKNYELAEKICNRIPNFYVFLLGYLEADFVAHYLINKYYDNDDTLNIIISSDKDMYQTIKKKNIILLYKSYGKIFYLDKDMVLPKYLNYEKMSNSNKTKKIDLIKTFDLNHFDLLMSLVGDAGDDVPGVKGIGPVRALELISNNDLFNRYIGDKTKLIERIVLNNGSFFKEFVESDNKLFNQVLQNSDVVTKAFQLISFDALSKWIDDGNDMKRIKHMEYITNIVNKKDITYLHPSTITDQLSKLGDVYITKEDIDVLYL